MGINRQQYNKYLSGNSMPSMHNFKRIADFFGVDEGEMLMPHDDFVKIIMRRPVGLDVPEALRQFFHNSRQSFAESRKRMDRYCGLYHAYFQSPAWPKGILKSLYAITGDGEMTYVKSVERLAWRHKADHEPFVHKYQGLALLDSNRLYLFRVPAAFDQHFQHDHPLSLEPKPCHFFERPCHLGYRRRQPQALCVSYCF